MNVLFIISLTIGCPTNPPLPPASHNLMFIHDDTLPLGNSFIFKL